MVYLKIYITLLFTLINLEDVCYGLHQRPVRQFDPNKLMEKYMTLRTDIEKYGSFHPNDLAHAINALKDHKTDQAAVLKTEQQITGKGFDPNGKSMFSGSQYANWGFTYYNPNNAMNQYVGQITSLGSTGSKTNGNGFNTNDAGSGFNPDKLNDNLMFALQGHQYGTGSDHGKLEQNVQNPPLGFDPDELNNNLMSILKNENPMPEPHQINNYGMGQSEQGDNDTLNSSMHMKNEEFNLPTFGSSSFNPDTLNANLIGSLGYDANAINKDTMQPVFSLGEILKTSNSTAQNIVYSGNHESVDKTTGGVTQQSSGEEHGDGDGFQSGYQAVHVNNSQVNQQESLHLPFIVGNNNGNPSTQKVVMSSNGNTQNFGNLQQNTGAIGAEVTQSGNAYTNGILTGSIYLKVANTSGDLLNNGRGRPISVTQTGGSDVHTVHATGIGSLGVGLQGKVDVTGVGSIATGAQGGINIEKNGDNQSGQKYAMSQTGGHNTDEAQATGIGGLGMIAHQVNSSGSHVLMQTLTNNVENVVVTGIGGLGSTEGNGDVISTGTGNSLPKLLVQNNMNTGNGNANVVGIGGLGGKSHFGNFNELNKPQTRTNQ